MLPVCKMGREGGTIRVKGRMSSRSIHQPPYRMSLSLLIRVIVDGELIRPVVQFLVQRAP